MSLQLSLLLLPFTSPRVLELHMHASMSGFLNMGFRDPTLGLHSKPFHLLGHPLPSGVFSSSCVRWVQELMEHMSVFHEIVREHV